MHAEIDVFKPTDHELQIASDVFKKTLKSEHRLTGVRYLHDGNFTTAIATIQRLTNGRWSNTIAGIGNAKRNPIDAANTLKGRSFSLSRAIKNALASEGV